MTTRVGRVVCDLSISVDGYSAGLHQTEERPFGDDGGDGWGRALHGWMFGGSDENRAELERMSAPRAFIMGRNMFGPVRGAWDRAWNGWWGDDPSFHAPVFVLTHHPRDPQPMDGGTTFHFVTDGIESALPAGSTRRPDHRACTHAGGGVSECDDHHLGAFPYSISPFSHQAGNHGPDAVVMGVQRGVAPGAAGGVIGVAWSGAMTWMHLRERVEVHGRHRRRWRPLGRQRRHCSGTAT